MCSLHQSIHLLNCHTAPYLDPREQLVLNVIHTSHENHSAAERNQQERESEVIDAQLLLIRDIIFHKITSANVDLQTTRG